MRPVIRNIGTALFATALLGAVGTAGGPVPAQATSAPAAAGVKQEEQQQEAQLRGVWIASVHNIDWPSGTGLTPEQQRDELVALYDQAVDRNFNAVFVQVRPTADAFWPSPYEPWSAWLTGTQGQDPGYDPLGFAVSAAHERGLEFHGWFNPYRVATHTDPARLDPDHPARQHPGWTFSYNGQMYYDPGIPAVREFVQDAMMHAAEHYDLDGVHFDDYFYPYPADGQPIPDQDTYAEYGGDFSNIDDWRRNNVDLLVQEMGQRIEQTTPGVEYGISPFGIWRNQSTDPNGSATNGLQSYDALHADTRKWVLEGHLDYIAPQVYWHIGFAVADYAVLVPWWSGVVDGTGVNLYIGQPAYRIGQTNYGESTLTDHLTFNRDHPQVLGDIYFSAASLNTNAAGAIARVVADHYTSPVPPPD